MDFEAFGKPRVKEQVFPRCLLHSWHYCYVFKGRTYFNSANPRPGYIRCNWHFLLWPMRVVRTLLYVVCKKCFIVFIMLSLDQTKHFTEKKANCCTRGVLRLLACLLSPKVIFCYKIYIDFIIFTTYHKNWQSENWFFWLRFLRHVNESFKNCFKQ